MDPVDLLLVVLLLPQFLHFAVEFALDVRHEMRNDDD